MEPQNKVQITPPIQIRQKKKLGKKRIIPILIISLVIVLLLIALVPIGLFNINSNFKNSICSNFSADSTIYKKLNCTESISNNTAFEQNNTITLDQSKISTQEDLITQIVEKTSPAVVTVAASTQLDPSNYSVGSVDQNTEQNIGSGFIVRSDGLIVTNAHVVSDETLDYSVILSTEKTPIPVKNIYRDTASDIAIVKIDRTNLPTLKLGESDNVKQGNTVVAIGSPLGDLTGSVTSGIISGLNRDITAGSGSGTTTETLQGVFQTDAAVNPGNSGGPLLNSNGEAIGINFATSQGANNISFAIPIDRVKTKLSEYQNYGRLLQPFIGIAFTQRTFYLTDGTLTGALITQVQANSPAQTAGVLKGDIFLTANGKSLDSNSLQTIIQSSKVGDDLKVNLWRKSQKIDVTIKIGDRTTTP